MTVISNLTFHLSAGVPTSLKADDQILYSTKGCYHERNFALGFHFAKKNCLVGSRSLLAMTVLLSYFNLALINPSIACSTAAISLLVIAEPIT